MRETGTIYGNSLFSLASEEGSSTLIDSKLDALIKEQLEAIEAVREEAGDFFSMLDAPQLSTEEKLGIADAVFEGCHPYVVNTVKLLVEKRSLAAFGYLVKAYVKAYNKAHNIAVVTAVTAVELSSEAEASLTAKLRARLGKEIVLKKKVDPSVIGGVTLRTDGLLIDGSVRGKLEDIKKEIVR